MIAFDDKRWEGLQGGYRVEFDPRPALHDIEAGRRIKAAWELLWEELHHQGDVGEASYAAVPHLVRILEARSKVDWNFYALISTIEIERHRRRNPAVPAWLRNSYRDAWRRIPEIALRDLGRTDDPVAVTSILGALAIAKGQLKLGVFIAYADPSEIDEWLEDRNAWSECYSEQAGWS
jgi:hypothetical protein